MSGTALEHPLVLDYLIKLDLATRRLPTEKAKELREQIASHLAEELPPDADSAQVRAALARLGPPAQLATDAGAAPRPIVTFIKSVRPRTWIAVALVLIAVGVAGKWCDYYLSAGSLEFNYGGDWWYAQDAKHEKIVSVSVQPDQTNMSGTVMQNTTPIRSGQRQGYVVAIYNPNRVTETIVGDANGNGHWNNPGSPTEQLSASRGYHDIANGVVGQGAAGRLSFGLPVSIPPFQSRLVRVLWTSDLCLPLNNGPNGISVLYLRVRVGWFTRTEAIPQQTWQLIGPSHGRCLG